MIKVFVVLCVHASLYEFWFWLGLKEKGVWSIKWGFVHHSATINVRATVFHFLVPALVPFK